MLIYICPKHFVLHLSNKLYNITQAPLILGQIKLLVAVTIRSEQFLVLSGDLLQYCLSDGKLYRNWSHCFVSSSMILVFTVFSEISVAVFGTIAVFAESGRYWLWITNKDGYKMSHLTGLMLLNWPYIPFGDSDGSINISTASLTIPNDTFWYVRDDRFPYDNTWYRI